MEGDDGVDFAPEALARLVAPHVESFNYFLLEGLQRIQESLPSLEVVHPGNGSTLTLWIEGLHISKPLREESRATETLRDLRVLPRECRQAGSSYTAPLTARVCWRVGDGDIQTKDTRLSQFPVMVNSRACNLHGLDREQLLDRGEEANEVGGYFIVNGNEKLLRLLVNQRRHYIMGMVRSAYARRGKSYSEFATAIRCVAPDETSMTVRVHYLTTGSARLAFVLRKQEFFVPVVIVLRALVDCSDKEIFDKITAGVEGMSFAAERVEIMLQEGARLGLHTRAQCLAHLGKHFRLVLDTLPTRSDEEVGEQLLRDIVFVHLVSRHDKLNLLVLMLRKLYALASGGCQGDNPDSMLHQEVLLPGLLIQQFVKERLQDLQSRLKDILLKEIAEKPGVHFDDASFIERSITKACALADIGKRAEYLLATGNLISRTGMGLSQTSGFSIVAERLNFLRFLSHFRSVHRGAYFQELRTTTVRKLLPDSWGFMCPVHTPDGAPCGLLNHLAAACEIVVDGPEDVEDARRNIASILVAAGMVPASPGLVLPAPPQHLPVMLDGMFVGSVRSAAAPKLVAALRRCKVTGQTDIPASLEVAHIPFSDGGAYPGLFLFTSASRFMRPVRQISHASLSDGTVELIGTLEQAYMDIKCPDGGSGGSVGLMPTHEETMPTAFLSAVASMTPWSDFNQSPRNMYQCQMAKQTMGTPLDSYPYRSDTKLYRIHTPQRPIARTHGYNEFKVDEYPLGTNAVVAVLANTGYDMEDAMIINKSSLDRGFGHGTLIKNETIDLAANARGALLRFGRGAPSSREKGSDDSAIGPDGLPLPGSIIRKGSALYSVVDETTGAEKLTKHKQEDPAVIAQVTALGSGVDRSLRKVNLQMLYNRNPVTGDKFSSRHGQKGVLSFAWQDENMPFVSSTGMRPDIIINPHAFPSRMTIGMLVESLASKVGSLDGCFVDATPFRSSNAGTDARCPAEAFGDALAAHGFSRQGSETMISGTTGTVFQVDIFIGLVYYQRLRHMVSDKFQCRSVGPINQLTHQPVGGRKLGGGIRVGEMERDALLGHGAAYLLQDRLHLCSDRSVVNVCTNCGGMLAVSLGLKSGVSSLRCKMCESSRCIERVALPHVLLFLASELAAMGIKIKIGIEERQS